jgi:hypothetical protein
VRVERRARAAPRTSARRALSRMRERSPSARGDRGFCVTGQRVWRQPSRGGRTRRARTRGCTPEAASSRGSSPGTNARHTNLRQGKIGGTFTHARPDPGSSSDLRHGKIGGTFTHAIPARLHTPYRGLPQTCIMARLVAHSHTPYRGTFTHAIPWHVHTRHTVARLHTPYHGTFTHTRPARSHTTDRVHTPQTAPWRGRVSAASTGSSPNATISTRSRATRRTRVSRRLLQYEKSSQ